MKKKFNYFKNTLLIFWIVSLALRNKTLIYISGGLFIISSFMKSYRQFKQGDNNSGILNLVSAFIFLGIIFLITKTI